MEGSDGHGERQSSPCNLGDELEIRRTLLISEVQADSGWREQTREALPLPVTIYGILTRASEQQLVYGGENVTPVEGCVGADLHGCPPNVHLEPWQQCRACDRTELFFAPKPVDEPRPIPREPECRNACQWPPHQAWINNLGELGLWRMKAKASDVAVVFSEMADCQTYAAERDRLTSTADQ